MDVRSLLLLTLLLACVSSLLQSPRKNNLLRIIHQWTFANFNYNSTQDRLSAEQLGYLTPGNVAILDGDYYIDPKTHKMRIFVTTPQFLPGTPATFYEIRDQKRDEPVMSPFPSWESQNIAACSGPISVYRVLIDKCGLLWVLDTGMVETFMVPKRACKPKILIYDLNKNDELVARYEFPEGVLDERSIVINLITESYQKDCKDSIAYIADVQARGLIMFDWPKRTSWRVENTYFYPFPDQAIVRIMNTTFQLMDGLFGLALSPATDRQRKLYFHSAASIRESWISTSALKNKSIISDTDALRREFHHSEDLRVGQSTVEVMTEDGILIYAVLNKNALACWNQAHPLKKEFQHVIYEDNDNLQFVSGMKLKDKTLMITSSKLQNYIMLQANGTDVKYRVMIIDNVDKLLDNSPCRKGEKGPILAETEGSSYYPTTPKHTTSHHIHHEDTILPETERWSYHPTTPKHTTSHHIHIDHKHSTFTPLRDEIDDKEPVFFHPPHKNHGHPPYWHQGHEPASVQKQIPHEQTTHSTFQFDDSHLNNPTAESKHQSTSSDQQSPQAPKSPTNPTSRDPADHNVSSRAEKLSAESFERESRTRPSVFSKPILYQSPEELSRHRHDQLNNLELD